MKTEAPTYANGFSKEKGESIQNRVLEFYTNNHPLSFTADEVASLTNISLLNVRPSVTKLKQEGKLVRTGRVRTVSGIRSYELQAVVQNG